MAKRYTVTVTQEPVVGEVTATEIKSATTSVSVDGAAAPTSGQVLTALNGTSADWQTPPSGGPAEELDTTGAPVVISGAAPPTTGQVLTALTATTADWQDPSAGGPAEELATTGADVDVGGAAPPSTGQVLTATSPTTATWQTPSTTAENLGTSGADVGVGAAAPPSTGQVLTATSATTATWQTPSTTAEALGTSGSDVAIGAAAPPTAGQVLTATSPTAATWQTPTGGGGTSSYYFGRIAPAAGTNAWNATTWTDVIGGVISGANWQDIEAAGISRSGSDFTFTEGGHYVWNLHTTGLASSGQFVGFRLVGSISGVLATHGIQIGTTVAYLPSSLLVEIVAGEIVTLEYAVSGTTSGTSAVPTIDGQTMSVGHLTIHKVNSTRASGDTVSVWWPDYPVLPAHAKSDAFPGSTLNPKWLDWDVGGNTTETVADGFLTLVKTSTAGVDWSGKYQPVEAGAYTISVNAGFTTAMLSSVSCGLFLSEDLTANPTTADFKSIILAGNTTDVFIQHRSCTGQTNVGTNLGFRSGAHTQVWLRIRVDGAGNAGWDYSTDGRNWHQLVSAAIGFTPVHFGLLVWNQGGLTAQAAFRNFLVYNTANFSDKQGSYIQLGSGGGGITLAGSAVTTSTVITQGQRQDYNASGGTFTLTAPVSPTRGQRFAIKEANGSSTAITVSGNGNNIENPLTQSAGSTSFSLGLPFVSIEWVFDGTRWLIV